LTGRWGVRRRWKPPDREGAKKMRTEVLNPGLRRANEGGGSTRGWFLSAGENQGKPSKRTVLFGGRPVPRARQDRTSCKGGGGARGKACNVGQGQRRFRDREIENKKQVWVKTQKKCAALVYGR